WLAHASLDWFWSYPVVTAPVMALLGAAAAPALREPGKLLPLRASRLSAAALVLVAIVALPLFASDRYLQYGLTTATGNPAKAYSALDRSQKLNPLSDQAYLAEGQLAEALGDPERARSAYENAIDRTPDDWVGHYLLGVLVATSDPAVSHAELSE